MKAKERPRLDSEAIPNFLENAVKRKSNFAEEPFSHSTLRTIFEF